MNNEKLSTYEDLCRKFIESQTKVRLNKPENIVLFC